LDLEGLLLPELGVGGGLAGRSKRDGKNGVKRRFVFSIGDAYIC